MTLDQVRQTLAPIQREITTGLGVKALAVFGSTVRGEAGPGSDVDILVEFDGPASFNNFMELKERLEDSLGVHVDLVTRRALRPALRDAIEKEAVRVA